MASAMDVDGGNGFASAAAGRGKRRFTGVTRGYKKPRVSTNVQRAVDKAVVTKLRKMTEIKYKDTSVTHAAGTAATITPLTDIASGDSNITRSGRKINLISLSGRCFAQVDNDNFFGDKCRVIIFRDNRQVGDTTPTVTQVLESAGVYAHLNKNNAGRFTILRDWFLKLSPCNKPENAVAATYATTDNIQIWKVFAKLKGHASYNGDASTDIEAGGLYLLQIADATTMGFETTIFCNLRLRWSDQ